MAIQIGVNHEKSSRFGNTGAGKSITSKKVAQITGLPLYALDVANAAKTKVVHHLRSKADIANFLDSIKHD